tara:strand:- start:7098 stop:7361 length:264 start_codon:yes stop_codon:yes gene_type:complete
MTIEYMETFVKNAKGGFDDAALKGMIDHLTRNSKEWKGPFEAQIPSAELKLAEHAAIFYTGGGVEVTEDRGETLVVCGAGYWHHIGS